MLRTSARRGALSRTLSVALLITASGLLVGCDAFRSTKMGFANSTQKDQVRQGEVVQVAVYRVDTPGQESAALIPLAAIALEKVIDFASGEFQKHLEKVAELHEATYQGKVVIPSFDPSKTYDIHIVRSVAQSAEKPDEMVEVTRLIYRLSPNLFEEEPKAAVLVRSIAGGVEYTETAHLKKAAVRLDRPAEPFELSTSLKFFAAAPDLITPEEEAAGEGEAEESGQAAERTQLGDTVKHTRTVRAGAELKSPPPVKITPRDGQKVTLVAREALGYFVTDAPTHLFEIEITVTEKDPSRAAERNRAAQEAIKDITPELVKFLKEQAGLGEETEE